MEAAVDPTQVHPICKQLVFLFGAHEFFQTDRAPPFAVVVVVRQDCSQLLVQLEHDPFFCLFVAVDLHCFVNIKLNARQLVVIQPLCLDKLEMGLFLWIGRQETQFHLDGNCHLGVVQTRYREQV